MAVKNIDLGDKIKQIREKLGLNQHEFADFVSSFGHKVTYSAISHYEKNTRRPSYEILTAICILGNVSPSWMLDYNEEKISPKRAISSIEFKKPKKCLLLTNY